MDEWDGHDEAFGADDQWDFLSSQTCGHARHQPTPVRFSKNGSMAAGHGVDDWDEIPDVQPGGIMIFDDFLGGNTVHVHGPRLDGTPWRAEDAGNEEGPSDDEDCSDADSVTTLDDESEAAGDSIEGDEPPPYEW